MGDVNYIHSPEVCCYFPSAPLHADNCIARLSGLTMMIGLVAAVAVDSNALKPMAVAAKGWLFQRSFVTTYSELQSCHEPGVDAEKKG